MRWLVSHWVIDGWSVCHLLGWLLIARICVSTGLMRRSGALLASLVMGLLWELIEQATGVFGSGGEPLLNRWVSDPIFNLLGAYLGAELGLFYRSLPIFKDIILTAADELRRNGPATRTDDKRRRGN